MTAELANLLKALWPVLVGVIYVIVLLHYGQWRDRQQDKVTKQVIRVLGRHSARISRLENPQQGD